MNSSEHRRLAPPSTIVAGFFLAAAIGFPASADDPAAPWRAGPEGPAGGGEKSLAVATRHMAVSANPHATRAAVAILRAGGTALDAAIAAQMVLGVVEPQSSGLGGGGFLLYFDAASGRLRSYDGRETAPAGARPDIFLRPDGTPLPFPEARAGGLSVGVPGLARMLELAHRNHGRLAWRDLFAPAIDLAETGFAVSPRLAGLIAGTSDLRDSPAGALFFHADGAPLQAGEVLRNPALADSLRRVAEGGAEALHSGPLAEAVAAAARDAPAHPGSLAAADLAAYSAIERPPLCAPYRTWRICGMGPPSSGGLAVGQMLGLLERFDLAAIDPASALGLHLFAEAGRLAFADRDALAADPDFIPVPTDGLLDPAYLAARSRLISPDRTMDAAAPGLPLPAAPDPPQGRSTTHLSIVDSAGNVAALTSSIESGFGSRLVAGGFPLNNQLTDFAFAPERDGRPVANRVEPGKRPRSSMAPTIVFDAAGRPILVLGSPGGSRIIGYVARTISAVLDRGLDPQAAVDLPHAQNRGGATEIEEGSPLLARRTEMEALGHVVRAVPMTSGLHVVRLFPGRLEGAADRRREGLALGD